MDVERKWVEREKCSEAASVSRLPWVVVLLEVVFLPVTQPRETPRAVFTWQPEYKQPRADSEAKFVFVFLPLVLSSVLGLAPSFLAASSFIVPLLLFFPPICGRGQRSTCLG